MSKLDDYDVIAFFELNQTGYRMYEIEKVPIESIKPGSVFSLRGCSYQHSHNDWDRRLVYIENYHFKFKLPFGTMVTPGYSVDTSLEPWYDKRPEHLKIKHESTGK